MEMDPDIINEILTRLVKLYNPQYVYLFGSHAWGEPQKNSDLDICVILSDSNQSQAERIRSGLSALKGIHVPVDILVLTQKEIAEHVKHPSTLIYKVFQKGLKLYEAA